MNATFTEIAFEDYLYWQSTDKQIVKRINLLIKDIQRPPFQGIGKPEALKFDLAGKWSRRIDEQHRLVYGMATDIHKNMSVIVYACRYHY